MTTLRPTRWDEIGREANIEEVSGSSVQGLFRVCLKNWGWLCLKELPRLSQDVVEQNIRSDKVDKGDKGDKGGRIIPSLLTHPK